MNSAKFTEKFPDWPHWQQSYGHATLEAEKRRWRAGPHRAEARGWAAAAMAALVAGRQAEVAYEEGLPKAPGPVVIQLGNGGLCIV